MRVSDYRTLAELYDLKDSRVMEYLEQLRQDEIAKWTNSTSDREATLAQGAKRVLDAILKDICEAYDTMQEQKKRKAGPDMRQAF